MAHHRQTISDLVARVLDGTELKLAVDGYRLEESLEEGHVEVECLVHSKQTGERESIRGQGVGLIDAVFTALHDRYSDQHSSLKTLHFQDFQVSAQAGTGGDGSKSDMTAEVQLKVLNSQGRSFRFNHTSPSITGSSIHVVRECVEFFVNSERAFLAIYRALQHAKKENRHDSVELYTAQLATLVEATSYSHVIEKVRSEDT